MNEFELRRHINAGNQYYEKERENLITNTIRIAVKSCAEYYEEQIKSIEAKNYQLQMKIDGLQSKVNELLINKNKLDQKENELKARKYELEMKEIELEQAKKTNNYYSIQLSNEKQAMKATELLKKAVLPFISSLFVLINNKKDYNINEIPTEKLEAKVRVFLEQTLDQSGVATIWTENEDDKTFNEKIHDVKGIESTGDLIKDGTVYKTITPGIIMNDAIVVKEEVVVYKYDSSMEKENEDSNGDSAKLEESQMDESNEEDVPNSQDGKSYEDNDISTEQNSPDFTERKIDLNDASMSANAPKNDDKDGQPSTSIDENEQAKSEKREDRLILRIGTDVDAEKIQCVLQDQYKREISVSEAAQLNYTLILDKNLREKSTIDLGKNYETVMVQCKYERENRAFITIHGNGETLFSKMIVL